MTETVVDTDVLVVGGGTAGAVAAIAAGRLGARTVLVECGSQLGGTMTTGGVEWPGLFFAWGQQVVAGIGWELVRATAELQGDPLPDFSQSVGEAMHRHPSFQVALCGGLYAALAEEACTQAGVHLRYYEAPDRVLRDSVLRAEGTEDDRDGWTVTTHGKGVRARIQCRQLIDCTANASVVDLAGFERHRGADRQPGSIIYTLTQPSGWKSGAGYKHQRYVLGADVTTAETHTDANVRGRAAFLKAFRTLRASAEGRDARVLSVQPETNSRETYRIVGEYEITRDDYASGRVHDDAVACMYYPIDLHTPDGVKPQHLPERTTVTIPLRALIPRGSRHLLVAGRCVASDRLANSGLRVQASCMAMGQAAGAAAALAARLRISPGQVPLDQLRAALRDQGAVVPGS
ncbi:MAG: FAD-dependent oxidoreductase [Armatimonadetes bacterium]|nr:FAD-dependent oxidoreductase [Armatimonadota bacterium]